MPATSPAETPAVRIRGLTKHYENRGERVTALERVDLTVRDGEFLCLLGPSGCGKSTLLRAVGGLIDYDEGMIELAADGDARTNMVFQQDGLFPWKTVLENVTIGLKMRGVPASEREAVGRSHLEAVNLDGFEDAYPHELSGGMKQRVGIARGFANDPDILLMDEPFSSVDVQRKRQLQRTLLDVWRDSGKTVVFVTHDVEEAILLGDRLGVMTTRPGSVEHVVTVGLDRPRTRDTRDDPQFHELRNRLWAMLDDEPARTPADEPLQ